MTTSIENLFKHFVMIKKVVEDHFNSLQQKEKLMQKVRDAKKQKESTKKDNSQFELRMKPSVSRKRVRRYLYCCVFLHCIFLLRVSFPCSPSTWFLYCCVFLFCTALYWFIA
ncbi:NBS-containing resistance-like protein [Trifolium medium]|uniref:NBS-containing resistance-like protein n=1 Tax=Trifolium medium TaxID=97028 RepID=A0A392MU19_9FABA|nr:NBS-containing resistance-like protein [Trifolium medium]